jgi:hypothetical protein
MDVFEIFRLKNIYAFAIGLASLAFKEFVWLFIGCTIGYGCNKLAINVETRVRSPGLGISDRGLDLVFRAGLQGLASAFVCLLGIYFGADTSQRILICLAFNFIVGGANYIITRRKNK